MENRKPGVSGDRSPDTRSFGKRWSEGIDSLDPSIRRTEVKDAIKELFPPEVPPIIRWRLAVFAMVVLFLFHIAWACGWLESLGVGSGFATATELNSRVTAVESNVKDIKLSLIEQSIFDAKESECTATDPQARRFFASRVQALSREYSVLSNLVFNIPPCRSGGGQ